MARSRKSGSTRKTQTKPATGSDKAQIEDAVFVDEAAGDDSLTSGSERAEAESVADASLLAEAEEPTDISSDTLAGDGEALDEPEPLDVPKPLDMPERMDVPEGKDATQPLTNEPFTSASEDVPEASGEPRDESPETVEPDPVEADGMVEETRAGDYIEPDTGGPRDPLLPQPATITSTPPPRRGGFWPLVLGGIVAAGLGAGALYYGDQQGWIALGGADTTALEATIGTQTAEIEALRTTLDAQRTALETAQADIIAVREIEPDLSPATGALQQLSTDLDVVIAALGKRIDEADKRIASVEKQPIPAAELPAEIVAAYEAKFTELQTALEQRITALQTDQQTQLNAMETGISTKFSTIETGLDTRLTAIESGLETRLAAIETRLDTRLADIEAAQTVANEAETTAKLAAQTARARAALAEIDMALDTGAAFAEPLDELAEASAAEMPAKLTELAETGAPTLTELQANFPDAARASLVASTRAGTEDGSVNRVTAFFRTQLGARSIEPRDGTDPDAVLSRAEDAVGRGDLEIALTELATLPEAGQAALADWKQRAETRIAAKAALGALAEQLNPN